VFYQTKGDANKDVDGWSVAQDNILGKVYFTIPYAGEVLAFAKSKIGIGSIIIFPAILVIIIEVFNIVKEIRKKSKESPFDPGAIEESRRLTETYGKPTNSKSNIFGPKIFLPIIVALLIGIPSTLAFLSDTETSTGNVITAAASFATPTPTPTETPTPTP